MTNVSRDTAHDQELYVFEGESNFHLDPQVDAAMRQYIYYAWESGFASGWNRCRDEGVNAP